MPQRKSGHEIFKAQVLREGKGLRTDFEKIREKFSSADIKGSGFERILRAFLRGYLPYRVGHGEVFSIEGFESRQADVVIANEYHVALRENWDDPQKFIIESVECAAETKSVIASVDGELHDIFVKAKAFKKLIVEPDVVKGSVITVPPSEARRFVWRRPYFAFAFDSKVSLSRLMMKLEEWDQKELRSVERPVVDGLFVLDKGAFCYWGKPAESRIFRVDGNNTPVTGYHPFPDTGKEVLSNLLMWLYAVMPRLKYAHDPVSHYLQPSQRTGRLRLQEDGSLKAAR